MAIPGPLHQRLTAFEGTWSGAGTVFPNPWGSSGPTRGTWVFRFDPPRLNLLHDYAEERADGERFDAHGVLTLDPAAADYVWFWFDSYGYPPLAPARGNWQGDRLILEKSTPRGRARSVFTLGDHVLGYAVASKLEGETEFSPVAEGSYRREGR
jgi:hypothetical protein